jgi:hypothetical protein
MENDMRALLSLTALSLALLTPMAEAINYHRNDRASSEVSFQCAPKGGAALEINASDAQGHVMLLATLWGDGYEKFYHGMTSFTVGDGEGRGMLCKIVPNQNSDCQQHAIQISFNTVSLQPGGSVSGTLRSGDVTAAFQGTLPQSKPSCQ